MAAIEEPAGGPATELPDVHDEPEAPQGPTPDQENVQRAMEAFARGSDNYNGARYQEALRDFLEAASLYASPDFQYNIGLCYEKLDKAEEAIRAFETYLKTKKDVPDRANVEDRIRRLRAELERPTEPEPKPGPEPKPPRDRSRPLVISGAALTAVGAAVALGGGIGLGIAAKRKSDELDDIQAGNPQRQSFAQAQTLQDQGKALELGQIAIAAAGGAIAIVGVALLAVGLAKRKGKAKGKAEAGASASLRPHWSGRGAGLSLVGRF
ncbi:MAG: hypothetical protein U0168_15370 [Nannocystaceae bacterium]